MSRAKIIHLTIIFLSLYATKDGVGADDYTQSQIRCINEIKMDFGIDVNTDPATVTYASRALLYLRFSSNRTRNTFNFEHANSYYRELFRHILYGPFMVIPTDYCDTVDLSNIDNPKDYANLVAQERSNCKIELLGSFHSRANTGGTGVMDSDSLAAYLSAIIKEIYFKHVLDDFKNPPGYNSSVQYYYHSRNYMNHVANNIILVLAYGIPMETPEEHCQRIVIE